MTSTTFKGSSCRQLLFDQLSGGIDLVALDFGPGFCYLDLALEVAQAAGKGFVAERDTPRRKAANAFGAPFDFLQAGFQSLDALVLVWLRDGRHDVSLSHLRARANRNLGKPARRASLDIDNPFAAEEHAGPGNLGR